MKKILFVFIAFFALLTSCEDDDFCSDPTTPRMVIVFYDMEDPTEKKDVPIYAWAEDKDSIYQLVVTDSILLPLNTQTTRTKYLLSTANTVDTLDLTYTVSDVFASEPCGFIANFNDFGTTKETTDWQWIDRIEVNVTKIENETETHISIFH